VSCPSTGISSGHSAYIKAGRCAVKKLLTTNWYYIDTRITVDGYGEIVVSTCF